MVLTVLGAVAILATAIAGWTASSQIESPPQCFEACFLEQWVAVAYSSIFIISALINLCLLPAALVSRRDDGTAASVMSLLAWQLGVLGCSAAWLTTFAVAVPFVGMLAALGIAAASVVVCVSTVALMRGPVTTAR